MKQRRLPHVFGTDDRLLDYSTPAARGAALIRLFPLHATSTLSHSMAPLSAGMEEVEHEGSATASAAQAAGNDTHTTDGENGWGQRNSEERPRVFGGGGGGGVGLGNPI